MFKCLRNGGGWAVANTPPDGQELETWWQERIAEGLGDMVQGQFEFLLTPYVMEMQRIRRWHIPVRPRIPPETLDMLVQWNDLGVKLNLIYELPVDRDIDDHVWTEIELIRRASHNSDIPPALAGTHVGRQGLTPALAQALNAAPFEVLLLDPAVTVGLSNVYARDPANDRRINAISTFMRELRSDLPVMATGISEVAQWHAIHSCGVAYAQGSLWLPPTPMEPVFRTSISRYDPEWSPHAIYPNAADWLAARGLDNEVNIVRYDYEP